MSETKKSLGIDVKFRNERDELRFEGVTNADWQGGFVHLSIREEGKEPDTIASFNQEEVLSVVDYYE